jgi:hypothetical protein
MSTTSTPSPTDLPGQQPVEEPAAPRSRYSMGTLPNMLRSMLVIGLFVLALVAIVPRTDHVDRPAVDALDKARQVAAQTGWTVQLPQGLGSGWTPTVASFAPGTEKIRTFTTVWTTPGGADIALKQAVNPTGGWVRRSVNDGDAAGTVQVSGRTFERFTASDVGQVAYVARGTGTTTPTLVAAGNASEDELKAFVAAMRPVQPTATP